MEDQVHRFIGGLRETLQQYVHEKSPKNLSESIQGAIEKESYLMLFCDYTKEAYNDGSIPQVTKQTSNVRRSCEKFGGKIDLLPRGEREIIR